jgi:creatinine amidohydrolase
MMPFLEAGKARLQEIREFAQRYPFAIFPVGSTEQHGPHLPLNTDNLIAERIALETARRSVGLVLPTMPLGYAWVWRDVPGTLTLRFDTYMRMVRDVAESLERWNIKAIFLLSGHGSNPQPIKHAVRELIHDRLSIKVLFDVYAGLDQMLKEADSRRWHTEIHAEEIETSMVLGIAPELVRMDLAEADYPLVPPDYAKSELSMGHLMRSGVFGDPRAATAAKGQRWLDLAAERSAKLWLDFLKRHEFYDGERRD